MPAPDRRRIVATFIRHGVVATVAETLRRVGVHLREETIRFGAECGALIDADSGEQLGGVVSGTDDRLELGPLLRAMVPGRCYVCIHSHPADTSFSPGDVGLLLRFTAILVIVAIGREGTWYLASFGPTVLPPSLTELATAYADEYNATLAEYEELRQEGKLTRRLAARAHSHAIWERVGPRLSLRYDRIEGR